MDESREIPSQERTREIVSSIKTKFSSFTPERFEKARVVAERMSKLIENNFGTLMPEEAKKRARTAIDNSVFVDEPSEVIKMFESQGRKIDNEHKNNIFGFHVTPEQIIIVKQPDRIADNLPTEIKETVIKTYGGTEQEALHRYGSFVTTNAYAHELAHSYVDPRLPLPIKELAAYFLQDLICKDIYGKSTVKQHIMDTYKNFAEKYGDDFTKYIFGGKIGILSNFKITRETDKLQMLSQPTII